MDANSRFYSLTLIVISLVLGFIAYKVMLPFVSPIVWASVFAIVFYPLYRFVEKRVRWRTLAALFTLLVVVILIIGPFSYMSVLLTSEITDIVTSIEKGETFGLNEALRVPSVAWIVEKIKAVSDLEEIDVEGLIRQNLTNFGKQMAQKAKAGVKNVVSALIDFVFMLITLFFFLRDGSSILKRVRDYLPFAPEQRDRLETQVKDMVISTIFGGVVVALIQGVMGGSAFYLLGIPSPVLWGAAVSLMSFVPMLGTFSVWGAMVVYLVIQGAYAKAIALFIFGTFGISLVDNIIKPVIIGGRTKMPALLILFSVLGGVKLFGVLGLIMGPMSVALFLSVFEIFRAAGGGYEY